MTTRPTNSRKQELGVIGVGFDNDDGHKRVTEGQDFALVGGSAETHERMTGIIVRMKKCAERLGKTLHDLSKDEFEDIAQQSFE